MNAKQTSRQASHQNHRTFLAIFILILIITGCLTVAANSTSAATYYLDAINGNDTTGDGNSSSPWKTLAKVKSILISGDTVKLRNGNYGIYYEPYGSTVNRTDWVTYEADSGQNPVLTRIAIVASDHPVNSYLRFSGITIDVNSPLDGNTGIGGNAVYLRDNNYVQLSDVNIIGAGYTPMDGSYGIYIRAVQHLIVNRCTIYGDGPGIGEGKSDGGISYANMGKGFDYAINSDLQENGRYNTDINITNCNIWSCGTAISITGSGWNVSNNHIHYMDWDGIFINQTNTAASGLTNPIIIANNEIDTGIEYGGAHFDAIQSAGYYENYLIIRNNIIHYIDGDAIFFKGALDGGHATQWSIQNNLIYDTMKESSDMTTGTVRLFNCNNVDFRNNTIIGTVSFEREPCGVTCTVFTNNIIQWMCAVTTAEEANQHNFEYINYQNKNIIYAVARAFPLTDYVWEPNSKMYYYTNDAVFDHNYPELKALFKNYNNNDFNLAPDSCAINFGDPRYTTAVDILGKTRDAARHSAGCYEYVPTDQNNNPPPDQNSKEPNTLFFAPIGNKEVNEGSTLTFTVDVNDPNIKPYIKEHNLPSEPNFKNNMFSWTPSYNAAGNYEATFATQDGQFEDSETINIIVNDVHRPPVFDAIGYKSVTINSPLEFSVNATAPDGNSVTYSAENLPNGAIFAGQTFDWTPDSNQVGTYEVMFAATDGIAKASQTVDITVNGAALPLSENFNSRTLTDWSITNDVRGRSSWSAAGATLVQKSSLGTTYYPSQLGTYASYKNGSDWTDYHVSLTMKSKDSDSLGVMFRYQNDKNYYRFAWNKKRSFRNLVKMCNGILTVLCSDSVPYTVGRDYQVDIVASGPTLQVFIDNAVAMQTTDSTLSSGSIAMYSCINSGSYFDNILVQKL